MNTTMIPEAAERDWAQRREQAQRRAFDLLSGGEMPTLHRKINYCTIPAKRMHRQFDVWLPPGSAPEGWENATWVQRVQRSDGGYDIDVESHTGDFQESHHLLPPDQEVRIATGYWRFADLRPGDWYRQHRAAYPWELCMDISRDEYGHLWRVSPDPAVREKVADHDPRMRSASSSAWRNTDPLLVVRPHSRLRSDGQGVEMMNEGVQPWELIAIATETPETEPMPERFSHLFDFGTEPAEWIYHWEQRVLRDYDTT